MPHVGAQFSIITRLLASQLRNRSIPGRGIDLFFSTKCPHWFWGQLSLLLNGYWEHLHPTVGSWGMKFTTRFHLVPKLRMSGSVPPQLLYAFMACTAIILPVFFKVCVAKMFKRGLRRKWGGWNILHCSTWHYTDRKAINQKDHMCACALLVVLNT